jgi:8-oxo-dGTP pyrophosphatase MutT (NUDIX family)
MAENEKKPVAVPVPAATVLLIRDGANGMEVFMVKRHHQIDFVAGALVFPGGKTAPGDSDAALESMTDCHPDWNPTMRALGAAAIREAFEESGILLAREEGSNELVSAARAAKLDHYRSKLDKKEVGLAEMLQAEKLRLACDRLVHFAHWITPDNMPKRFDTHFFLAAAMADHAGMHDGRETVDSVWIGPQAAIDDRKKWNVIFPTKLNLMKLAQSKTVAEAMATAKEKPPLTVTPWVENGPDGQILRIRDDAGYTQTSASMKDAV